MASQQPKLGSLMKRPPTGPDDPCTGCTFREYIAAAALNGLLAHGELEFQANYQAVARRAVHQADALIVALQSSEPVE